MAPKAVDPKVPYSPDTKPNVQFIETMNPHSVEISRGSNGKVTFSVKCYGAAPDLARSNAVMIFEELNKRYPYNS